MKKNRPLAGHKKVPGGTLGKMGRRFEGEKCLR